MRSTVRAGGGRRLPKNDVSSAVLSVASRARRPVDQGDIAIPLPHALVVAGTLSCVGAGPRFTEPSQRAGPPAGTSIIASGGCVNVELPSSSSRRFGGAPPVNRHVDSLEAPHKPSTDPARVRDVNDRICRGRIGRSKAERPGPSVLRRKFQHLRLLAVARTRTGRGFQDNSRAEGRRALRRSAHGRAVGHEWRPEQ